MSRWVSDNLLLAVLFERTMACGAVSENSGRSAVRQTRLPYEAFFLNAVAYRKIAYHLSYLMSVVVQLEPAWSRAFLRRCRFLDSEFQGEMLAVISKFLASSFSGSYLTFGKNVSRSDLHRASKWHSDTTDYTLSVVGSVFEVPPWS